MYARLLFGTETSEEVARRLVSSGFGGLPNDVRREELLETLGSMLEREGRNRPTATEAGMLLAREIAAAICRGELSPYEGAKRIWTSLTLNNTDLRDALTDFVGLASEWE